MAIALACHEGMQRVVAGYFDNQFTKDTTFTFLLHTDNVDVSTSNVHSTHTRLANSYYGGAEVKLDMNSVDGVVTTDMGVVQQLVFPQVTFTFTQDVPSPSPIRSIGIYGDDGGAFDIAYSNLYFIESLTAFVPMAGDVFKYTLTIKMGNASALT